MPKKNLYLLLNILCLFSLCIFFSVALGSPPPNNGSEIAVPENIKVYLQTDKQNYFLGENVILHFYVENTGSTPLKVAYGGDYRGGTRSDRFKIEAFDKDGKLATDPRPLQMNMGGLGGDQLVEPREKKEINKNNIPLNRYRMIEKPGRYKITVSHDLGWTENKSIKMPVAEIELNFIQPTVEEAELIVQQMTTQSDLMDSKRFDEGVWADWGTILNPVYLPTLKNLALKANSKAVLGIGSIETPDATKTLIDLFDSGPEAVRFDSLRELFSRIPDSEFQRYLMDEQSDEYKLASARAKQKSSRSWQESFSEKLHRLLIRELERVDDTNLEIIIGALIPLLQEGDYKLVVEKFNQFINSSKNNIDQKGLEKISGTLLPAQVDQARERARILNTMQRWETILQSYVKKGFDLSKKLRSEEENSAADDLLYIYALRDRKDFRPSNWESRCEKALKSPHPIIRARTTEICIPLIGPNRRNNLSSALNDSDQDTQIEAAKQVNEKSSLAIQNQLLETYKKTTDWRFLSYGLHSLKKSGRRLDAVKILVNRLDEPLGNEFRSQILNELVMEIVDCNGTGYDSTYASQIAALEPAWESFVNSHKKEIEQGRKFKPEAEFSADLMPTGWQLTLVDGASWPQPERK